MPRRFRSTVLHGCTWPYTTALALLLVLGGPARAAENEAKVITFFCNGVVNPIYGANKSAAPQSLQKSSLIVNFEDQTIFFLGYLVPVESVDGASIRFGGRQSVDYGFGVAINGNIDQATGRMEATMVMSDPTQLPDPNSVMIRYDLVCIKGT
jgi:hypothetical protein